MSARYYDCSKKSKFSFEHVDLSAKIQLIFDTNICFGRTKYCRWSYKFNDCYFSIDGFNDNLKVMFLQHGFKDREDSPTDDQDSQDDDEIEIRG